MSSRLVFKITTYYKAWLFITAVPNAKLCALGDEDSEGHVL